MIMRFNLLLLSLLACICVCSAVTENADPCGRVVVTLNCDTPLFADFDAAYNASSIAAGTQAFCTLILDIIESSFNMSYWTISDQGMPQGLSFIPALNAQLIGGDSSADFSLTIPDDG